MRPFVLLLLGAPLLLAQEVPEPSPTVAVCLIDGSVLISTGSDDEVQIRTPYGTQKIPIIQIRSARRLASGRFQVLAKGVCVSGDLISREFVVHTSVGAIRVQAEDLRSIQPGDAAGGFQDAATAALWWFADTSDGTCRDRVRGRAFALQDYEGREGLGLLLRKPGARGAAPCDDELDLLDHDYTLDLRFKIPRQTRQNVMILQKGNPADATLDYQLFVCPNGVICATSMPTGNSIQSPPTSLRREAWNTVTIVHRTQPLMTGCYLNGKCLASGPFPLSFGAGLNRGLNLGFTPAFGGCFDSPEAIQFLRISRVARSAEEIEETERGTLEREALGGSGPGILLRDRSFLRGEFSGLGTPAFRTRFGVLTLSEKNAGLVRVYRLRLPQLEKAKDVMREQILKLGSAQVADRDAAGNRLLSYGEAAVPVLRESGLPMDPEVRHRVAELLKKLEDSGVARMPACDLVKFGGFQIQGWLDVESVALTTRRGKLQVPISQIAELHFGRGESRVRPQLRLFSGETVESDFVEGSNVQVEAGFGPLKIPLVELKELAYDPAAKTWTLTTELAAVTGTLTGIAELVTPLGTLELPMSEVQELRPPGQAPFAGGSTEDR